MAASAPRAGGSEPEAAGSAEAQLQYSLLLQYLVGDKRQPRVLEPGSLGGIPSPAKSEEQKMIEKAMESCAFKAALACVGGETRRGGALGRLRVWGAAGSSAKKTTHPEGEESLGLDLHSTPASFSDLPRQRSLVLLGTESENRYDGSGPGR